MPILQIRPLRGRPSRKISGRLPFPQESWEWGRIPSDAERSLPAVQSARVRWLHLQTTKEETAGTEPGASCSAFHRLCGPMGVTQPLWASASFLRMGTASWPCSIVVNMSSSSRYKAVIGHLAPSAFSIKWAVLHFLLSSPLSFFKPHAVPWATEAQEKTEFSVKLFHQEKSENSTHGSFCQLPH